MLSNNRDAPPASTNIKMSEASLLRCNHVIRAIASNMTMSSGPGATPASSPFTADSDRV